MKSVKYKDIFAGKMKVKDIQDFLKDIPEDTEIYMFSHSLFPYIDNDFYCILEAGLGYCKERIIPYAQKYESADEY